MNYQQAVSWLFDLPRFTKKHPLQHTKEFLDRLGEPAFSIPAIHVAGTNGKGSVCAFLTGILKRAGKRTGTFTSPHLIKPNERISIDGIPVSDEMFLWAYELADEKACAMEADGEGYPTFFEMMFAMAMLLFQREQADCLILETGMGGRLDATNVIKPQVCAITSVSLDHMQILGNTVEKIAKEKAGIIKEHVPVVFDASDSQVYRVLREAAIDKAAPCFSVEKADYKILEKGHNFFRIRTGMGEWTVPFEAEYQLMNACIAAKAASLFLGERDHGKQEEWIREGIEGTVWPGRMEEVLPGVYLDGAHNEDAVRKLADAAGKQKGDTYLLFSVVEDKAFEAMAEILSEAGFKRIMITHMENARALGISQLKTICSRYFNGRAVFCSGLMEALMEFLSWQKKGDTMYIAGSLYLVGDIKKILSDQIEKLC